MTGITSGGKSVVDMDSPGYAILNNGLPGHSP